MNALVSVKPDYDAPNERAYRQYVEGEFALTYRKTENLIIPYGYYLGFNGVTGKEVVLGLNGSDQFTISIDGATAFALASDSSVSSVSAEVVAARQGEANLSAKVTQMSAATATVDGKLTASYALTVDVNGRIASMKLLSNGTTSSVKFLATTFSVYNGSTDEAPFVVEGGVVKAKKVAADSVTATEIDVASLDAISATIGLLRTASTGARMELESNQGRVYDSSNVLRVRWGIW